jgi:hypothetical protein
MPTELRVIKHFFNRVRVLQVLFGALPEHGAKFNLTLELPMPIASTFIGPFYNSFVSTL